MEDLWRIYGEFMEDLWRIMEELVVPCGGRCFFHCLAAAKCGGWDAPSTLTQAAKEQKARDLVEECSDVLTQQELERYRLGRSMEEESMEVVCRALQVYVRVWVPSIENGPLLSFGNARADCWVDMLQTCTANGAEMCRALQLAKASTICLQNEPCKPPHLSCFWRMVLQAMWPQKG